MNSVKSSCLADDIMMFKGDTAFLFYERKIAPGPLVLITLSVLGSERPATPMEKFGTVIFSKSFQTPECILRSVGGHIKHLFLISLIKIEPKE